MDAIQIYPTKNMAVLKSDVTFALTANIPSHFCHETINKTTLGIMTTERFHSRRGKNISLSDNKTVARRVTNWDDGIVFTEQPVALGSVFQVKILEYDDGEGYLGSIVSG